MYLKTTAVTKLNRLRKRIRGVAGGTSAGKTIGIEELIIDDAQSDTHPTLTSIVSESFPHLKRGAMRDFLSIMKDQNYYDDNAWNRTDFIYTFPNGSRIEFFSADMPIKVRGPRRDRLFVNEANNIPWETWDQLVIRTKEYVWADWNPTNEFWWYDRVLGQREDIDFITLTYKDNEALSADIVAEIESHKNNKNWWLVYGLGQLGEVEGRIYTDWQIIEQVPHEARLVRYGLDFGYSVDPTAIVAVYEYNGGYILDEVLYAKGLSNKQIADHLSQLPSELVIADSAEPKSIDELASYGIRVTPSIKGQGSVNKGIQFVQSKRISMTKASVNLIKEYRNYLWKTDMNGKMLGVPEGAFNHLMDATRYAINSTIPAITIHAHKPRDMLERKYARL